MTDKKHTGAALSIVGGLNHLRDRWAQEAGQPTLKEVDAFFAKGGAYEKGEAIPTLRDIVEAAHGAPTEQPAFHDVQAFADALTGALAKGYHFDDVVEFTCKTTVVKNAELVSELRAMYNIAQAFKMDASRVEDCHRGFANTLPEKGREAIEAMEGSRQEAFDAVKKGFDNPKVLGNALTYCAENGMRWNEAVAQLSAVGEVNFGSREERLAAAAAYSAFAAVTTGTMASIDKRREVDLDAELDLVKSTIGDAVIREAQVQAENELADDAVQGLLKAVSDAIDISLENSLPMAEMFDQVREVAPMNLVKGHVNAIRAAWAEVVPEPVSQRAKKNIVDILVHNKGVDPTVFVVALGKASDIAQEQGFPISGGQFASLIREVQDTQGHDRLSGLGNGDIARITGDLANLYRNVGKALDALGEEKGADHSERDTAVAQTVQRTAQDWTEKAAAGQETGAAQIGA